MGDDTESTRALVQRMYEAGADQDFETFMSLFDPEVVLEEPAWLPFGGTHRGLGAVQAVLAQVAKVIDLTTIEVDKVLADGDTAVVIFTARLHTGDSVLNVEEWTVRNGRVVGGRVWYMDPGPVIAQQQSISES